MITLFFRYEEIVADVLSDDDSPARPAGNYSKKKSLNAFSRPKALYTVGETRKIVQDEKDVGRRKMGVREYMCVIKNYLSYFSTKTYVVGAQNNRLCETVLLATQNLCLK